MRHLLLATSLLLSYQVFGQVHLNLTFPDYTRRTVNEDKTQESTDWEYAQARMVIKDNNSTFSIYLLNQKASGVDTIQRFELKQNSEWMQQDGVDICVTQSKTGDERYLLNFISDINATNRTWITLAELKPQGLEMTGNRLDLENYNKTERETIMFINSDALTAYHYVQNYQNALSSTSITVVRDISEDRLQLSYSSKEIRSVNEPNGLKIIYPVEVPYQSALMQRSISRNLSFKNGVYTYRNDSTPSQLGAYGMGTGSETGFDAFKYSWFVPENIEILAYRSNRKGDWDELENGVIFKGEKGINNVLVEIDFKIKNTPAKEIEKTKTVVKEVVNIPGKTAKITVWDNVREDGDIISLSLNGEWIIRNLEVQKCETTFTIDLPHEENFLIMKAENLGTSPPNTAAFLISSGDFNKQIILNSDMGKSEMIVLKRE